MPPTNTASFHEESPFDLCPSFLEVSGACGEGREGLRRADRAGALLCDEFCLELRAAGTERLVGRGRFSRFFSASRKARGRGLVTVQGPARKSWPRRTYPADSIRTTAFRDFFFMTERISRMSAGVSALMDVFQPFTSSIPGRSASSPAMVFVWVASDTAL